MMRLLSAAFLAVVLPETLFFAGAPAVDGPPSARAPLTIRLEDFTLRLDTGGAIRARPGVLVLSGKGSVAFAPPLASERRQLALWSGSPSVQDTFEEACVRTEPGRSLLPEGPAEREPLAEPLRRRGERILAEAERETPYSGGLSPGDFVVMVRTRHRGLLAFLRLSSEPEDMMMIDVAGKRRIVLYPSDAHRKAFGFDYGDEYGLPYAVSRYDLDLSVDPDRRFLSGEARLALTALERLDAAALRLDPALSVSEIRIAGDRAPGEFYRPPGSDRLIVRFDPPLEPLRTVELSTRYAGRLPSQTLEGNDPFLENGATAGASPDAPYALFSNRIWWYPQSPVHNHAAATLRVRVPPGTTAIAPGVPETAEGGALFRVDPPVRYLALLVGRFVAVSDEPAAALRPPVRVVATENRVGDARRIAAGIGPILDFYAETIGEFPFPKLTVAVVPSRFPAGHSPGGLTVVGTPSAPFRAEDNPAIDRSAPAFQLAHELAHQWWGQAVGWRNYRHQWLSEAFAQYFAALYVRHASGEKAFGGIVGWLDAWARRAAGRGPVDLGVRAGAITGERWLFPAVVYDRGALALDALRRKVGDDAFFRALRSYYRCRRFDRADTDDLRTVMEATSGSSLESFFAFWIDGDDAIAAR